MQIANETGQEVAYSIGVQGGPSDCGTIEVDGLADLPAYDNQTNVWVKLGTPSTDDNIFQINCENTGTGQQVEMALIFE